MNITKQTRIIIDSDNERDRSDIALLLTLFFKQYGINVSGTVDIEDNKLHQIAGMFAHDTMVGNIAIGLEAARRRPSINDQPEIRVDVTSAPFAGSMNLAIHLRNHLAKFGWPVSTDGTEIAQAMGENWIENADQSVEDLAKITNTKITVGHTHIQRRLD